MEIFEQNLIQSNQNVINEENFENNLENNKPMIGRDSEPKEVVIDEGADQGMGSEDNLYDADLSDIKWKENGLKWKAKKINDKFI